MKDDIMGYYRALFGNKYYVLPSVSYRYYEVVVLPVTEAVCTY